MKESENNLSEEHEERISLWNPRAALLWSLLFTPIFGAFIHAKNWVELGLKEQEKRSMYWVYGGIGLLFITFFLSDMLGKGLMLGYFICWSYFANKQIIYVKQNLENEYSKRNWRKPLATALAIFVGFIVIATLVMAITDTNTESVTSTKGTESNLIIKGLYIGMDHQEACNIIKSWDKEGNLKIWDDHVISVPNGYTKCENKDTILWNNKIGKVEKIVISSATVNKIFSVSDFDAGEFAQAIVNNYDIPQMDIKYKTTPPIVMQALINAGIPFDPSPKPYWEYKDPRGVHVIIDNTKELTLEKIARSSDRKFD